VDIEELRAKGKELGITQAINMKEETLRNRISEIEINNIGAEFGGIVEEVLCDKQPSVEISLSESDKKFLDNISLETEWLMSLANQYNFNRFHYVHKFRAFRCYRDNKHLDWVSINDLSLDNVKKELIQIIMKHQPLQKNKQIINYPWRK